jgi:hypothetical protein
VRKGSLQTDQLYQEIIPYLIETGDAFLCLKKGKFEIYAFRAFDETPENPPEEPDLGAFSAKDAPDSAKFPASSAQEKAGSSATSSRENSENKNPNSAFSANSAPPFICNQKHPEAASSPDSAPNFPIHTHTLLKVINNIISIESTKSIEAAEFTESGGSPKSAKPIKEAKSVNERAPAENAENAEFWSSNDLFYEEKPNFSSCGKCSENAGKSENFAEFVSESSLETSDFVFCASLDSSRTHFDELLKSPKSVISLDFETYGKEPRDGLFPHLGELRLLSVHLAGSLPVIFDLQRIGYSSLPWVKLFENRETIIHNGMF